MGRLCCIKECDEPVWGHEFCRAHYQAWWTRGHPLLTVRPLKRGKTAKSSTKEYKSWHSAKMRCSNPNNRQWENYGARGIRMCESWRNSFDAFLSDMGRAPSQAHSLDRIDVNGNYEPGNCRWATAEQQNRNTRGVVLTAEIVASAKFRVANGEKNIAALARSLKVSRYALYQALAGTSWKNILPAGRA